MTIRSCSVTSRRTKSSIQTYFRFGYDDQYTIIAYDKDRTRPHFQNQFVGYHMEFFKAGIAQVIKFWLQNGCKESPEDLFDSIKSEHQGQAAFFDHGNAQQRVCSAM